jgi:hypothetical protein
MDEWKKKMGEKQTAKALAFTEKVAHISNFHPFLDYLGKCVIQSAITNQAT